jgi:hypothetical protein
MLRTSLPRVVSAPWWGVPMNTIPHVESFIDLCCSRWPILALSEWISAWVYWVAFVSCDNLIVSPNTPWFTYAFDKKPAKTVGDEYNRQSRGLSGQSETK